MSEYLKGKNLCPMQAISREGPALFKKSGKPSETISRIPSNRERYSPILLATISATKVAINMNTKEIRGRKLELKLTDRQRAILVGLLLGDGHLETQNGGRTYRLKVEHGSAQADYVRWLFQELREWIPAEKPYVKVRKDGVQNIGFTTYSHGSLRFYGQQFYNGKRKRMPKIIQKMLEPISVAIWFMDDGSRKSAKHLCYIIHTLGYTKADLELVQKALQTRFGIKAIQHRQKEKYWRLYIPSESARQFESLIEEYVRPITSMKHKLITYLPKK